MRICSVEGCGRKHCARGYCKPHYYQMQRTGNIKKAIRPDGGARLAFLKRHVKHESDGCLEWPFACDAEGYGRMTMGGVGMHASRAMCILAHGPPAFAGAEAAHDCGNAKCVNPRHLRWATLRQNTSDKLIHGTTARGRRNPHAKLTEHQVLAIYSRSGLQRVIAARFGVTQGTVSNIKRGVIWAWLTGHRPRRKR